MMVMLRMAPPFAFWMATSLLLSQSQAFLQSTFSPSQSRSLFTTKWQSDAKRQLQQQQRHQVPSSSSSSLSFLKSTAAPSVGKEIDVSAKDATTGTAILLVSSSSSKNDPSLFGSKSPVENPSWTDAAAHLAQKAYWFSNGKVNVQVVDISENNDNDDSSLVKMLVDTDALIALGITSNKDMTFVKNVFEARRQESNDDSLKCQFALGCNDNGQLTPPPVVVGPYDTTSPSPLAILPWTSEACGQRLQEQMVGLFHRWTSDDFCVALMIYFNQFVDEIDWVKHSVDATWEKGPLKNAKEFYSMATKCGDCITKCLADEECSKCLNALNEIDTRDQVTSYRTIVSYESKLLQDFSFCILQKNNIFNCNAQIPTKPKVEPLQTWRGKPLTVEDGRSIIIGHLDDEDAPEGAQRLNFSWKVACGANVAYDQFPSQHQLFYKNVNGRDMWYDPVFRVETIDGRSVWCKRHYKVRNGPVPGTFRLSVLDNGVTSNEFWTVAGVADDLSWIVFHYAGAAGAVGQQYLGGLLCTPDGALPPEERREEIWKVLQGAGIQPWELFVVDNDMESPRVKEAGPAPLDFFRKSVLEAKAAKKA